MGSLQDEMKDLKRKGARNYVVKAGDSLSKIAKELLGDADRWPEILPEKRIKVEFVILDGTRREITLSGHHARANKIINSIR